VSLQDTPIDHLLSSSLLKKEATVSRGPLHAMFSENTEQSSTTLHTHSQLRKCRVFLVLQPLSDIFHSFQRGASLGHKYVQGDPAMRERGMAI
jgi:hypothetical protein